VKRYEAYLRFDLTGSEGDLARATLHVHKANAAATAADLWRTSGAAWSESSVNHATRPPLDTAESVSAEFGGVGWYEIDVTSLLEAGGETTLALTSAAPKPLNLFSREAAGRGPFLTIETTDVLGAPEPDPQPAPSPLVSQRLRWAPPELSDPETIELGTGETLRHLDPARDYIIELPDEKKVGATILVGGRNIVIRGGHVAIEPGRESDTYRRAIYIKNATGTVHIEGVLIDGSGGGPFDAIAINAPEAIVQIQNVRAVGVSGSFEGFHADVVQPWGGVKELRIDHLTASTDYQGLQIEQSLGPIGRAVLSNINLSHVAGGPNADETTFLLWLTSGTTCRNEYPVEIEEVYVAPRSGWTAAEVVWPPARPSLECHAEEDDRRVFWPLLPVAGSVHEGRPVDGDFVPEGLAGIGYAERFYGE
jgi:hypothetical protein